MAGIAMMSLAGCGKSPQDEFISFYEEQNSAEYNAATYSMTIDELSVTGEGSGMVNLLASQLKDMTLNGDYRINRDEQVLDFSMSVDFLGERIPVEFIWTPDNMYLSTSLLSGMEGLMTAFGIPFEVDASVLSELDGKYIEAGDELTDSDYSKFNDLFEIETEGENTTLVAGFIKTLDKSTFTKEEDVITHTFTVDEMKAFEAYVMENGNAEAKESIEGFASSFDDTENFDMTVVVNPKTNETNVTIAVTTGDETSGADLQVTITAKSEQNDEEIVIPTANEIVSSEEFEALMSGVDEEVVSDDEFNELLDELKEYKATYGDEEFAKQFDEYLELFEEYLTPEQLNKLKKELA